MYYSAEPLDGGKEGDQRISRTFSSTNLAGLWNIDHLHEPARSFRSPSALRQSEDRCSEDSQVLYIGERRRSRRTHSNLSSIGIKFREVLDESSGSKSVTKAATAEYAMSWDPIDREIFEWQHICHTGRSYWWSRDSKYARLEKLHPRTENDQLPRLWRQEMDDECLKSTYERQRRAVTENYLSDPTHANEIAHMIAIQLLSSCYTLPLNATMRVQSPDCPIFDKGAPTCQTKMISALRMHAQFRYSPCFGSEARNTSPKQRWESLDDETPGTASSFRTGLGQQTLHIGTPIITSRGKRLRRVMNISAGLEDVRVSNNHADESLPSIESSEAAVKSRQLISDTSRQDTKRSRIDKKAKFENYQIPRLTLPPTATSSSIADGSDGFKNAPSSQTPNFNYRLQPVIRSEPHHVFVQPVRELVIKRWRAARRRFGASLNAPIQSEDGSTSECGSAESNQSSCGANGDRKERRKRAQERGEIHSSSADSSELIKNRVSGNDSRSVRLLGSSHLVDCAKAGSQFETADPHVATAGLTAKESGSVSVDASGTLKETKEKLEKLNPKPSKQPQSVKQDSSLRKSHKRRKSRLSEVFTSEQFPNRIAAINFDHLDIVAGNSPIITNRIFTDSVAAYDTVCSSHLNPEGLGSPTHASSVDAMTSLQRPIIARVNTTGSQIFTPCDHGVEVDGFPVGPDKETWTNCGANSKNACL